MGITVRRLMIGMGNHAGIGKHRGMGRIVFDEIIRLGRLAVADEVVAPHALVTTPEGVGLGLAVKGIRHRPRGRPLRRPARVPGAPRRLIPDVTAALGRSTGGARRAGMSTGLSPRPHLPP